MIRKNNFTLTLTPELRLEQALAEAGIEDPATVIKLTVAGTINGEDFRYIREKMGKTLQTLDMSNASIENNRIERRCFLLCTGLTAVTIPDSVVEIGERAFDCCYGLKSFAIPDSVVEIGKGAFYCCESLTSIVISDSVIKIRKAAFVGTGLASDNIPTDKN